MNKDDDLKKDPRFDSANLRGRIDRAIKDLRDATEELDIPQVKTMPIIPVTGDGQQHKYFDNKIRKQY